MPAAKKVFVGLAFLFVISTAQFSSEEGCYEPQELAAKEAARTGSFLQWGWLFREPSQSTSDAHVPTPLQPESSQNTSDAQVPTPSRPKLLLHIGPYKTGTTSLQQLLIGTNNSWLEKHAKAVSFLKHMTMGWNQGNDNVSFDGLQEILNYSKTQQIATVVSCEGFSSWMEGEWQKFKARSFVPSAKIQVAMAYRAPWDRLVSLWIQSVKHSDNPPSLNMTLLVDAYVHVDQQMDVPGCSDCRRYQIFNDLRMYRRMVYEFGQENVNVVSYDLLREEQVQYSVYLLCNVTQQLRGESWNACNDTIANLTHKQLEEGCDGPCNTSPTPAAVQLVQVAREMHQEHCRDKEFRMTPQDRATQEVAELMPQHCVHFDHIEPLREEYEAFFRETGITKPSSVPSKEHCFLDRDSLSYHHRQLIQTKLLSHCYQQDAANSALETLDETLY